MRISASGASAGSSRAARSSGRPMRPPVGAGASAAGRVRGVPSERTEEMPTTGRVVVAHPQREPVALKMAKELGLRYFLNAAWPRDREPVVIDQDA